MWCDIEQAVARQVSEQTAAADPVILVILPCSQVHEFYAAPTRHEESLRTLVPVAAVMVPDVEYFFRRKLFVEFAGPQAERLDAVVYHTRVQGLEAFAPHGTKLGLGVHVGPNHVSHHE